MRRVNYALCLSLMAVMIFSCNKNSVQIVTQDTSYKLDPEYCYVAIPDSFKFNSDNIAFLTGQTNFTLNALFDGTTGTISTGNTITFVVKLKKALEKAVSVKFVKDSTLLGEYTGTQVGYADLSNENYSIPDVQIAAGATEAQATFTFTKPNRLSAPPGYLLPLRIAFADPVTGIKISDIYHKIFVKVNVEYGKDNIESSNLPIVGTPFNDIITFESDRINGLANLKDGRDDITDSEWYPSSIRTTLTMNLPEAETIKGILINTPTTAYQLSNFTVLVQENGSYIKHGEFSYTGSTSVLNVKFKTPVHTQSIRLEKMRDISGREQPDIVEIRLIR